MKKPSNITYGIALLVLLTAFLCFSCSSSGSSEGRQEKLFLEGADNWAISGNADWSFSSDELVGKLDSGAGFVITRKSYRNFELTLEFKPDSSINSGVFIRCKSQTLSADDCYELNIWDLHPNQSYRTGAMVKRTEPLQHVETLNKWNTYKIVAQDDQISASINGIRTVELVLDDIAEGYIALQAANAGMIRFRSVQIRELNTD